MMGAEGIDLAGNIVYRAFFSLKEETRWPFELFLAGEDPADVCTLMKWIAKREISSPLIGTHPGTFESLLDQAAAGPEARTVWTRVKRKQIFVRGPMIAQPLRDRT